LTSGGLRCVTIVAVSRSVFDVVMQHFRPLFRAAVVIAAALTLNACALFGCGAVATNGGGFGGCSVGTRF
jgi:hypothetical protein